MIKTHCSSCGSAVYMVEGMSSTECGCGERVSVSKIGGVGTAIGKGLAAVGVTKQRYNQVVNNQEGDCGGCNGRERWLDNLTHRVMRSDKVRIPDERVFKSTRFVTTAELLAGTQRLLRQIPPTITSIVGIARSGLLPATVLATERHLPLFAVDNWGINLVGAGTRSADLRHLGDEPLVVDDTLHNGGTLQQLLKDGHLDPSWTKAVVYVRPEQRGMVHYYAEGLATPHILEWNIFNCPGAVHIGCDLDGVICDNPPPQVDDDGRRYLNWLEAVRPLHLPRREPITAIITARLEKYREPTERWLDLWGVRYRSLVMGPWADNQERSRANVAQWKAERADATGCDIFLESEPGLTVAMDGHCIRCSPVYAGGGA